MTDQPEFSEALFFVHPLLPWRAVCVHCFSGIFGPKRERKPATDTICFDCGRTSEQVAEELRAQKQREEANRKDYRRGERRHARIIKEQLGALFQKSVCPSALLPPRDPGPPNLADLDPKLRSALLFMHDCHDPILRMHDGRLAEGVYVELAEWISTEPTSQFSILRWKLNGHGFTWQDFGSFDKAQKVFRAITHLDQPWHPLLRFSEIRQRITEEWQKLQDRQNTIQSHITGAQSRKDTEARNLLKAQLADRLPLMRAVNRTIKFVFHTFPTTDPSLNQTITRFDSRTASQATNLEQRFIEGAEQLFKKKPLRVSKCNEGRHLETRVYEMMPVAFLHSTWQYACSVRKTSKGSYWEPVENTVPAQRARWVRRLLEALGKHTTPDKSGWVQVPVVTLCRAIGVTPKGKRYGKVCDLLILLCESGVLWDSETSRDRAFRLLGIDPDFRPFLHQLNRARMDTIKKVNQPRPPSASLK